MRMGLHIQRVGASEETKKVSEMFSKISDKLYEVHRASKGIDVLDDMMRAFFQY